MGGSMGNVFLLFYYFFLSSPIQTVGSSQGAVYCFPALTNCLNGLYLFPFFPYKPPPPLTLIRGRGKLSLERPPGTEVLRQCAWLLFSTVEVPARRCFLVGLNFFHPSSPSFLQRRV